MITLTFVSGTLEIRELPQELELPATCRWDARSGCHRAPASAYAEVATSGRIPVILNLSAATIASAD